MPTGKEFYSFLFLNDDTTHWLTHATARDAYREASVFANEVGDGYPDDDKWLDAVGAFIVDHDNRTVQMIRLVLNDKGKRLKAVHMGRQRRPRESGYLNFRIVNGEIYDPSTFLANC